MGSPGCLTLTLPPLRRPLPPVDDLWVGQYYQLVGHWLRRAPDPLDGPPVVPRQSIQVGKRADLVILSADPTKVAPETIKDIKVMETIKDGRTIFPAG